MSDITTKKKKWALKDQIFAESIVQQYSIIENSQDFFDKDKDHLECIKEVFLSGAKILENEAEDRKITSKELKAAIKFLKDITNRADFTDHNYKEVVAKGNNFICEEMEKVKV